MAVCQAGVCWYSQNTACYSLQALLGTKRLICLGGDTHRLLQITCETLHLHKQGQEHMFALVALSATIP